ncbi:MAG: sugar transferase, partial [Proteobacteria bacterium]
MQEFLAKRIRTLQIAMDALSIGCAWAISYWLRFHVIGSAQIGLSQTFTWWFFPVLGITLYFFLKNEQYDTHRQLSVTDEIMKLFRANALSVVAFIIVLYFFSEARISRLTIVLYAASSTLLLIVGRLVVRSIIRKMRRRGFLLRKVFVVGDGSQVEKYLESVRYTPSTGLQVIGTFGGNESTAYEGRRFALDELEGRLVTDKPDVVVLGFEDDAAPFVAEFIRNHYDQLFRIQVLAEEKQALLGLTAEVMDGMHIMTLNEPRLSIPELTAKRAMDFFGSAVGLLILSPLLILLGLLVRISSPGPIFFGQERVGISGSTFKMWKFRTMKMASPEESRGWTVENDPRRTKIGTFLRKTSIDELPQLWNVLVGDMSLVGPRPEQTHFVEKFRTEIPAYMLRHKMKAGITGWAQVSGWRGDTSLHKR